MALGEQRCLSGQSCVALTSDGPAATSRPLCLACVEEVQEKYNLLPEIQRILPAWKGGLRGENGEAKVSGSRFEPPCPLRVEVVDLIDEIGAAFHHIGSLRIIDLITHVGGVDWAFEVRRLYRVADKIIGISPHWSRRITPCPECDTRSLGTFSGTDLVQCSTCSFSTDLDGYRKLTLETVRRERRR